VNQTPPSKPGHFLPSDRLKGTDQGRPLLHEEARCLFLLPVDVLDGHEDEDRDEDHDCPDDQPRRDHRPKAFLFASLAVYAVPFV